MKIKKQSIGFQFIVWTLLVCIAPFVAGGLYIEKVITKQVHENFEYYTYEILRKIHNKIDDGSIKPVYEAISLLAMDDRTAEVIKFIGDKQIKNPEMLDSKIYQFVVNYSGIFPRMMLVGLGTEQGGYLEYPGFFTESGYDSRSRMWYQEAVNHKGTAYLTDPYAMKTTGEIVVAFSRTVQYKDKILGVVVAGWNVEDLGKRIEEFKIGTNGYVILLSQNNKVIVCSKHNEWLMKTPLEIGIPELVDLADDGKIYRVIIEGKRQLVSVNRSPISGWKAIAIIDESELAEKVSQIMKPIFITCIVMLFLILGSIFWITKKYVIEPISELTEGVTALSNGDLEFRVPLGRKNEFGILAVAFNEMADKLKANFKKIQQQNEMILWNTIRQKEIEKQIARLDRLNIIGEMAAGIAHEVRNPMTTVRGFLQMLAKKEHDSPNFSFYGLMIEELDRANSIISEFLSLAKNKAVNLEYANLNHIIEAIIPLIEADARISNKSIVLELSEIPELLIDEKEIRQVILNMVRNGLEAMDEKGEVRVRTYCEENAVVMAIADQGSGIKVEILENIGIPFQTTKENGTGLGLPVCYSIAARHNAKISVKTGDDGTEFFVKFERLQDN
ncbi:MULTISPECIES: HAMP domain-containing histidine kinase [Pelosinus]|uniref:histidine kinase n=1 Tax=Pelosinus fermentans B4 TaxID=1149862 RepID=I8RJK5_9FIRM|nr:MULTISPECIES: HAMP domain-containing histidine kinase [Pelosinus]EIW20228.1 ATP-binding region ATPase domain protein [Pelosinus fermentans B4]EIW25934.1 multi-sensor signal transduction histidine kinase [Pelosinus fermentans A11]OAM93232.1 multi-sensor signal transduction histidine kinase [Pelosinus fermentans DSM 17108]SDQ71103.1 Signal transduction histidine kinase regulating C4-dicarboxylate transport system [Pelosinus fermentans]